MTREKRVILKDIDLVQAMIVQDFIIYTTTSEHNQNAGMLYRKHLGSKENATLVADKLASPQDLCQIKDAILINGLGNELHYPNNEKAVVSVSIDSLLTTKNLIQPRVLVDGIQSGSMVCTVTGTIYYSGYNYDRGIFEIKL